MAAFPAVADMLPLGDGNIAESPQRGQLFACNAQFAAGATMMERPWMIGQGWDSEGKPEVTGQSIWPAALQTIRVQGEYRVISGKGLPKHTTGGFPVTPNDEAHTYDPNPYAILPHALTLRLPAFPTLAAAPSCVPPGIIGVMLTGAPLYNALDPHGRDAPAYELYDSCDGHPDRDGQYHYHQWSRCFTDRSGEHGMHSDLVGYALDGFGIYGPAGEDGESLTNQELDACHGHIHPVLWDGKDVPMYHYHFTQEFPYSIGCFAGAPISLQKQAAEKKSQAQKKTQTLHIIPLGPRGTSRSPTVVRMKPTQDDVTQ